MKRIAIITGSTRGIGKGLFRRLASININVATIYHSDVKSAELFEKEATSNGIEYLIEQINVREFEKLDGFVERVIQKFGRIDYLINNAGIDDFNYLYDITLDDWRLSQDIILNAPFYLSKLVLPIMRTQKFGRIINIGASSKDYYKGAAGIGAFGVHKAALTVLTKTLALEEIKNGITVNMVAPGSTKDASINPEEIRIPISQIPIGRRIEIDEVVDAIMYFLSDNANSVTGQFIGVNGGLST